MSVNQQANQQLSFLKEKIHQIGSAIFFNQSDAVLKLPTSLVTTMKVDEFGYVWFFIKKPHQDIKEFESEFPVRLDFFRKGVDYFLQVIGKGWMVTDPEEMYAFMETHEDIQPEIFNEMVLVKVKMQKAEYYETQPKPKASLWQYAVNSVTTWFRSTNNVGTNIYFPAS
jgi:general stress protein 26